MYKISPMISWLCVFILEREIWAVRSYLFLIVLLSGIYFLCNPKFCWNYSLCIPCGNGISADNTSDEACKVLIWAIYLYSSSFYLLWSYQCSVDTLLESDSEDKYKIWHVCWKLICKHHGTRVQLLLVDAWVILRCWFYVAIFCL